MTDPLCIHELTKSNCDICNKPRPRASAAPFGGIPRNTGPAPVIIASFDTEHCPECGMFIEGGYDEITMQDGDWVHRGCAEE